MKKQIVTICLITIAFTSFSQNKKDQIETLNSKIDSCVAVMSNQSTDIKTKQIKIAELEQKLIDEQQKTIEKDKVIANLKKENSNLLNLKKSHTTTIDSLKIEIESLKSENYIEFDNNTPPSEWVFAKPKYENVTIFFDPIHNQKTGNFLEPDEVFSAGEIKNGFMEVEYYYGGMQETGWVRITDLEQASIPKTDDFHEDE